MVPIFWQLHITTLGDQKGLLTYFRVLAMIKKTEQQLITDRIIEDGSYFRLSNVTLGYDVPVSDGIIESMDLYLSGINLFTITGYSGYNPEITSFLNNANIVGVDWNGLPNVSTVTLGVNVNF